MASIVDLRSDTVTQPTQPMRAAMAFAQVGDDMFADDPTVNRLQETVAKRFDMPAALFVPSGTMANQLAIRTVCEPADEIILHESTHSINYETAGPAAISGVSHRALTGPRGTFTADDVEAAIRPDDIHFPRSRMVIIENTCNRGGGKVWPREAIAEIREVATRHGLHMHLDGARLMNACVAAGCAPTDYTRYFDSVSLCFSKGLGAPVGSILVGSPAFIARARRFRKLLGGAMRQSGILAAAALYALEHHVERLAEDHANAKRLAEAIAELPGIDLDPRTVETNIVIFGTVPPIEDGPALAQALEARGVRMFAFGPQQVRAVTHLDVNGDDIDRAIAVFREICTAAGAK